MRSVARSLIVAALISATSAVAAEEQPLRVVESVDLARYAGKWYEIARLPNKFQARCVGEVVARYSVRPDRRLDVINQCRESDGELVEARGIARKGSSKSDAILQVRFAPALLSFLPMVWGDYWIIGLGPDYTWAVVGEPGRQYLWILSRSPRMTESSYGQALEIAAGNGFDVSRVVKTPHKN
jgi:apolipoprotein D and lipocalin family protein